MGACLGGRARLSARAASAGAPGRAASARPARGASAQLAVDAHCRASASRRAAARAPQVKTDDEDVTAEDMQGHVLSILAGGAGAHLGDKRRRAAAARA
jgi:hypothetical protein